LSYGICRCDRDGKFLEVNEAMVKMLGYASKEELLAVNLASGLIQDLGKRAQLLGQPDQQGSVDPIEIEWKRKDHTTLKVRFLGQEILGAQGQLDAYEVITEDVTKQRQLEDHLRQQAARDPLTGLANCRHLAEVLDMEIKRSERTGREFALLLFDLDGLKQINDRYGHLTGSHAICRVADVLSFCRDIDTAALRPSDGKWVENCKPVGLVVDFPDEKAAWVEVGKLGLEKHLDNPAGPEPTFKEIAEHWRLHELRKEGIIGKKAVETVNCSEHNLDKYVLPRWGGCLAGSIKPSEVEGWFEVLATVAQGERKKPLKWPTIDKINSVMSQVYAHAQRQGLIPTELNTNPFR